MDKICSICGDTYDVFKYKGGETYLCSKHRHQMNRHGIITDNHPSHKRNKDLSKCEICGSNNRVEYNKILGLILCGKHSAQARNHGKIFERTIYDKNEIVYYDTYAEIILYDNDNVEIKRAKVDLDDVDKVIKHKWYYLHNSDFGNGYACAAYCRKSLLLHKFITNTDDTIVIDHKNCDKLDCRKKNLRYADKSKNSQNREPPKTNTSGFTGVTWNKNRNRWYARLEINGEKVSLGSDKNKEEAILMRIKGEIKYYKEFRNPHNEQEYIKQYGELPDDIKELINKDITNK